MVRKTRILFSVIFILIGYSAHSTQGQQSLLGRWVGSIGVMGTDSSFQVDFTLGSQPEGSSADPRKLILKGTIDSPRHRLKGAELKNVRLDSSRVHFELSFPTYALFEGNLKNDQISGTYEEGELRGTFSLKRVLLK
jgi:hypothetical protein